VHNGVCVPLIVESVMRRPCHGRTTIGVLHVFQQAIRQHFIDEDVRLLERLARNATAVIQNAQMFREVVEERKSSSI